MGLNALKYPADRCRGSSAKYHTYAQPGQVGQEDEEAAAQIEMVRLGSPESETAADAEAGGAGAGGAVAPAAAAEGGHFK